MNQWGLTDRGNGRAQNQDYFTIVRFSPEHALAVVCDGMGGAKSGNVASRLATDVFIREVKRTWNASLDDDALRRMLVDAVELANRAVYEHAQLSEDFSGMGTTLVAAFVKTDLAIAVNVGDSRAYLLREQGVTRITEDHSVVQLMVRRGEITEEEARTYPGKNLITRAVGTEPRVSCDVFTLRVAPGDAILLCSDGLSNLLTDQELLFEVVHAVHKEQCCQHLIEIAKDRGAPDNITAVLMLI